MGKINKIITVSAGDPAGIGAEITAKSVHALASNTDSKFIIIGREQDFENTFCDDLRWFSSENQAFEYLDTNKQVGLNLSDFADEKVQIGAPSASSGMIAYKSIEQAVVLCQKNKARAIVTAPISKDALKLAGFSFTGHTTIFKNMLNAEPVMTFYTPTRENHAVLVSLVSMHIPLMNVKDSLKPEKLEYVIRTTNSALKNYFGIEKPRIAVSGLNPHAGEGGMFGTEESEIINPVVENMCVQGLDVVGAIPPDTVFYRALHRHEFDGVVSLYHDQGLIAVKTFDFLNSVQMTLGLPFLRTSVDHGTAYDIAGKGIAEINSMVNALKLADKLI